MKGRGNHYSYNYSKALSEMARIANSTQPLKKILKVIAKSTTKALKAAGCSIMLLNSHREYLSHISAYGLSDLFLRKGSIQAHKSLPEVLEGKVVAISDASKDKRVQYPEVAGAEKITSILGVPIIQREEVIGEIRVYTHEPHRFSEADKNFLLATANISAMVLERDQTYPMLEVSLKEQTVSEQVPPLLPRPAIFAHPSEEEFVKLLDFYRIEWLYEPRSFPLEWEGGKITEMFTPDFYLPELDLFVELTTLKQSLITEKNRKLRHLKELYPEINIKLLNKSDYLKLLAKYGYGPLGQAKVKGVSRILFSHNQIRRKVRALAKQISHDYEGGQLVLIGILKGVVCFLTDLMQHLSIPITVDFMAISYYSGDREPIVKITKDLDESITGRDVLMVEDIVDTGMTLNYVLNHLRAHNPASLRVCTLLDKKIRRLIDISIDYTGFEIPDEFVVGYGLDYRGEYRNLPFIGVLSPEAFEREEG